MANPHTGQNKSLTSPKLADTLWFDISDSLIIFMNSASPSPSPHPASVKLNDGDGSRRNRRHDTFANVVSNLEARAGTNEGVISITTTKRIKMGDEILLRPYLG